MNDILPEETGVWQNVEAHINKLFQKFGYLEIRTPLLEQTELFTGSIGNETDIVSKEIYSFLDKKGRNIALRPEATASVVRAAIENNLINRSNVQAKLYYLGPMFRYERPQGGRQRQFYQAGIEYIGEPSSKADVDVIVIANILLRDFGIQGAKTFINSVGCPDCRPGYTEKLKEYVSAISGKLCEDCQRRASTNILRIFDCKVDKCQEYINEAPRIDRHLCGECSAHLDNITESLKIFNISFEIDPRIVRGLDYYTRTVFEIKSGELGAQNAVCGGGRYDDLIKGLGGEDIPAVGMAIGLDRLISILPDHIKLAWRKKLLLYVADVSGAENNRSSEIFSRIEENKRIMSSEYYGVAMVRNFGRRRDYHLKKANILRAKYAAIIEDGRIFLRDMEKRSEEEKTVDGIISVLEKEVKDKEKA